MTPRIREYSRPVMAVLAVYWVGLFTLTHLPASLLPGSLGVSDRLAHLVGFSVLSLLCGLALATRRRCGWPAVLVVAAVLAGYGGLDEWTQQWIPGRSSDIVDWYADLAGVALGSSAAWAIGALLPPAAGRLEVAPPPRQRATVKS